MIDDGSGTCQTLRTNDDDTDDDDLEMDSSLSRQRNSTVYSKYTNVLYEVSLL